MKKPIETRVIKKYQNRRLYDTATSTYIILDDIKQMIIDGDNIQVTDVKSGADVTRSVLLQILIEEEATKTPILSNGFLLQIIRFYGKAFQPAISPFLEQGIDLLRQTQKKFYAQLKATHSKDALPSSLDLWKEFWQERGPQVQQNIFDYLNTSTANFLQVQEQVQEQLQTHAENFINLMQFPFSKPPPKER
jgi:polyhydroxyalkanoate synthesis repressor PhaR